MIQFYGMKVYWIAYRYQNGMEMIDGPYGTFSEADSERDALIMRDCLEPEDRNLVVVTEHKEVMVA